MRIIAFITDSHEVAKILKHIGRQTARPFHAVLFLSLYEGLLTLQEFQILKKSSFRTAWGLIHEDNNAPNQ
jgi:hypothetical protein